MIIREPEACWLAGFASSLMFTTLTGSVISFPIKIETHISQNIKLENPPNLFLFSSLFLNQVKSKVELW